MHGRMYPTDSHVCFYSNVFGRERKVRASVHVCMSRFRVILGLAMMTVHRVRGSFLTRCLALE